MVDMGLLGIATNVFTLVGFSAIFIISFCISCITIIFIKGKRTFEKTMPYVFITIVFIIVMCWCVFFGDFIIING